MSMLPKEQILANRLSLAMHDWPKESRVNMIEWVTDALKEQREAGRRDEGAACWDAVCALIKSGPLGEPANSERNGIVLAANHLRARMDGFDPGQPRKDLSKDLVKLDELKHVPNVSKHDGHDPADPSALLVETLAMVECAYCSDGDMRWLDPTDKIFLHDDDYEARECEADHMLQAALKIGVPIYTGAELEFPEPDEPANSPTL